jgi:nucleoid DNA-binding protein
MNQKPLAQKSTKTLTRRDVVLRINSEIKITQQEASEALSIILDSISDCLADGGHVEFRDFGVFEIVTRKSRIGRNPNKPEDVVVIPARKVVKFKPGKRLRKIVSEDSDS